MRLHEHLASHGRRGEAPEALLVARISDAFGVLPSEALREWRRAPDLVLRVLEVKSYAHWFEVLDKGQSEKDFPRAGANAMFDLVCEHHAAYLQARMERMRG